MNMKNLIAPAVLLLLIGGATWLTYEPAPVKTEAPVASVAQSDATATPEASKEASPAKAEESVGKVIPQELAPLPYLYRFGDAERLALDHVICPAGEVMVEAPDKTTGCVPKGNDNAVSWITQHNCAGLFLRKDTEGLFKAMNCEQVLAEQKRIRGKKNINVTAFNIISNDAMRVPRPFNPKLDVSSIDTPTSVEEAIKEFERRKEAKLEEAETALDLTDDAPKKANVVKAVAATPLQGNLETGPSEAEMVATMGPNKPMGVVNSGNKLLTRAALEKMGFNTNPCYTKGPVTMRDPNKKKCD